MKVTKDEGIELRRQLGLWTADEAAGVLGCPRVAVYRAVCFGRLGHNRDAGGRTLIAASDVQRYMQAGSPGIGDTPTVCGDGWIRGDGKTLNRAKFAKRIQESRRSFSDPVCEGITSLAAFLIGELRADAYRAAERLTSHPGEYSGPLERYYAAGPDHHAKVLATFRERVESFSIPMEDRKIPIRSLARLATWRGELATAIKEAL